MAYLRLKRRAIYGSIVAFMLLAGAAVHATDEEPVCHFLLRQIGVALKQASAADDDARAKAQYLERIALMERNALQSAYPSTAAVFDNELARANQSLEAAQMRSQIAQSDFRSAITTYVQQCPQHFAAIQGSDEQLALLAMRALSDPSESAPTK